MSQQRKKQSSGGFDPTRLITGGGLGLNFYNNSTYFMISPIVGYRLHNNFAAGVGLGFQYHFIKDYYQLADIHVNYVNYYDYRATIFFPSVWVRYKAWEQLILHAEFQLNMIRNKAYRYALDGSGTIESYNQKMNAPALIGGIGYRQPISANASLFIMGTYDFMNLINPDRSIHVNTIVPRVGIQMGF